ncbi:MAG TPA: TRAP transporter large permease [Candidatus Methylomirabilis sp.]|nr:TRAP transporter large permease [Candidatus Methylomirabilis sp.]
MLIGIGGVFLLTILLGVPIAFGMGLAGAGWILLVERLEAGVLARRMYYTLDAFPLISVPLFIMIGFLAEQSGLLPQLVRWVQFLLGKARGGVAYLNVLNSMVFAGISGTAISDIASLGRIEIDLMRRAGYELPYSAALTAATSICGPIIPPSVAMILYALAAGNISIGGLFMAGALPGVILGLGMIVMCWFKARRGHYGVLLERPPRRELLMCTVRVLPLLALPVLIVGGVVSGVFTVTESAAVGVVYTLLLGFVVTRELTWHHLYDAVVFSGVVSSVLGVLMGSGMIVSWIFTRNRVTHQLTELLVGWSHSPIAFMCVVAITLLVLGCLMDATAIIVALTPLVAPIAAQYGIHELQFGLVFVFTCMVGLVTPPVGVVLFMVCALVNISMETLSRAIVPFVIWMVFVVVLLIFVPPITLFLPGLVGFR